MNTELRVKVIKSGVGGGREGRGHEYQIARVLMGHIRDNVVFKETFRLVESLCFYLFQVFFLEYIKT